MLSIDNKQYIVFKSRIKCKIILHILIKMFTVTISFLSLL